MAWRGWCACAAAGRACRTRCDGILCAVLTPTAPLVASWVLFSQPVMPAHALSGGVVMWRSADACCMSNPEPVLALARQVLAAEKAGCWSAALTLYEQALKNEAAACSSAAQPPAARAAATAAAAALGAAAAAQAGEPAIPK